MSSSQPQAQSQGYAIELYFDPALENQVLKAWNVLARRQISTHLIEIESRPHITLFSSSSNLLEPSKIESLLKSLSSKSEPLSLTFSTIGTFPNTTNNSDHNNTTTTTINGGANGNVLFLAPTPSVALLNFQSQLCELLRKEGVEVAANYCVDSWIPYCAVAQQVPKARMAEAFCVLRDLKLPVAGYAMDVGLVEFSPVREVFSVVLGSSNVDQQLQQQP